MGRPTSKFQSYIDKNTQKRYRFRKYIVYIVVLAVFVVAGKVLRVGDYFNVAGLEDISLSSLPLVSDLVDWYESAAFVDDDLFTDYSGVFPDIDDLVRREMAWLARMWGFWVGVVGLVIPLVLFVLFQVGKRSIDRRRSPPPSLDKSNLSIYQEIRQQVYRAYWRANNHNLEKSFFLVGFLGTVLFAIQFLLQPFVMLPHDLLISVLVSFMVYMSLVYFFYLYWQRFPHSRVIGIIDKEMDLRQSLLTALEVGEDYRSSSLYLYLLKETKEKLCKDNILRFFPRKFPRLNYRNVGTTTFLLGVATFLVSLSLPVMALVYNNLRTGLFSPAIEKMTPKEMENVILGESNKIRLMKNFLADEKESPELETVAKELSDLAKKLDKIAMREEEITDFQAPTLGLDKKLDKSWLAQGDEEAEEDEASQEDAPAYYDKQVITGQSLDLNLALQIKSIIKDLIRYDLEKKSRDIAQSKTDKTKKQFSPSSPLSAAKKSSVLGAQSKRANTSFLSVKKRRALTRISKDIKKLRKLTVKLTDIQKQLDNLPQQRSDSKERSRSQSDQGESRTPSLQGGQNQQDMLPTADQEQANSIPDKRETEARPETKKQAATGSGSAAASKEDSSASSPSSEPSAGARQEDTALARQEDKDSQAKSDTPQEEKSSSAEEEQGEEGAEEGGQEKSSDGKSDKKTKETEVTIQPTNLEFIRDELEELAQSMGEWDYAWEDIDANSIKESLRFKERMRVNGLRLKQFSEKLISIANPEDLAGIAPDIARHAMKIESPNKIRGMMKIAKDREIMTPGKTGVLSAELRLIGSDLNYLATKVEQNIMGDPRFASLRKDLYEKNPALANRDGREFSSAAAGSSPVSNVAASRLSPENLKTLPSISDGISNEGETKLKGLSTSLPTRIPANVRPLDPRYLSNLSGIEPDSSTSGIRGGSDGRVKEIIGDLKSIYAGVKDLGKITPVVTSRTINNRLALTAKDFLGRVESLQRRIRQDQSPNNIKNLANNMALVTRQVRNQGLGKLNPQQSPENAVFKDPSLSFMVRDINQIQDKMRSERNPDQLQDLSMDLAQRVQKFQDQLSRQGVSKQDRNSKLSQRQTVSSSEQILELASRMHSEGAPRDLKKLSVKFIRRVQSYRQEIRMAGATPKNITDGARYSSQLTQLDRDLKKRIDQMRRKADSKGLKNSASRIARSIQQFESRNPTDKRKPQGKTSELNLSMEGLEPNPPDLTQASSLSGQILQLASRMSTEQNPRNLENLSTEFAQRVHSYRRELQNTAVPQDGGSGAARQNSQFARFGNNLKDRISQLRRDQSPENQRNLAEEMARNIREFENQNPGQTRKIKRQTPRMDLAAGGAKQNLTKPQQTASLGGQITDLASRMRSERDPRKLKKLSSDFTRQIQSYSRQLQNAGVPPENLSGGKEEKRQLAQLDNNLQDRIDQMRRDRNPQNLRSSANRIAKRIQEFERNNLKQDRQSQGQMRDRQPQGQMQDRQPQGQMRDSQSQGQMRDSQSQGQMRDSQSQGQMRDRQPQGQMQDWQSQGLMQDRQSQGLMQDRQSQTQTQDRQSQAQTQDLAMRDTGSSQRRSSLSGQISQLSSRMRSERNPGNMRELSSEFARQVQSYRQVLQNAQNLPGNVSDDSQRRRMAQLDSDLKKSTGRMRRDQDPENLRNMADQMDRSIQEFEEQSPKFDRQSREQSLKRESGVKDVKPNSPERRRANTLSEQIQELASQMRTERRPRNLENLSTEFVRQVRSYSQQIQNSGSTPMDSSKTTRNDGMLEQLGKDLRRSIGQMRPGMDPKNLRNMADQTAKRIQDFEDRSRRDTDRQREEKLALSKEDMALLGERASEMNLQEQPERNSANMLGLRNNLPGSQQESLKETRTVNEASNRFLQSKENMQDSSISRESDQSQKRRQNSKQNVKITRSQSLSGRNSQLASLARDFQNMANRMQNSRGLEDMQKLSNEMLDRTKEFMDQAIEGRMNPTRRTGLQNTGIKGLEDRTRDSAERLRQERSPQRGRTLDGGQKTQDIQGLDSGAGTPPESANAKNAGDSVSKLSWQMERLSDQLQDSMDPARIKELSQDMLKTSQEFQNKIQGGLPSGAAGQGGDTKLQMSKRLDDIQNIARKIQKEDSRQNLKNLFNMLSKSTQEFSRQIMEKGRNLPTGPEDSQEKTQLDEMDREMKRLIDQMRQEKDLKKIRDKSNKVQQLARQMQKNFAAMGDPSMEIQEASFSTSRASGRSSDREVLSDREKLKQSGKGKDDKSVVSPVQQSRDQSPGLSTPKTSRQASKKGRQYAKLNRQTDRLTSELRQETDPKNLRELSKNTVKLADRVEEMAFGSSQYRPQSLAEGSQQKSARGNIESRTDSFNPQQRRQLSRIEKNLSQLSRDVSSPDSKNNERRDIGSDLKQQVKELNKLSQEMSLADPEPQQTLAIASNQLQQLIDETKSPSKYDQSKDMAGELAGLSQKIRNLIQSVESDNLPTDRESKDDMFDKIRDLSKKINSKQTPEKIRNLRDRLADSLSRMQDKFLKQMKPEKMDRASMQATKIPQNIPHTPTGGDLQDSMADQLITEMIRLSKEIGSESDSKRLQQLGRRMSDVSRKLLDLDKSASSKDSPMQKLRRRAATSQDMQRMLDRRDSKDKASNDRRNLKLSMQNQRDRSARLKDPRRESLPQDRVLDANRLSMRDESSQKFIDNIEKNESPGQDRDLSPAQQTLMEMDSKMQKLKERIGKENDPGKLRKLQKRLVKLNDRMIKLLKENLPESKMQSPDSSLSRKKTAELSQQMRLLSHKLDSMKVGDNKQLDQISQRMDLLAERISPSKRNLSTSRTKKKSLKRGGKDEDREVRRKSSAAVKMIDGTIQKLKAFGGSQKRMKERMAETPKGEADMGEDGKKDRQLMLADRFEAQDIARDTNVIPDTGEVRNVLSMEKNLHKDDILERVIKRLELNKQRIEQAIEGNPDVKDYSGTSISRKASRQPAGLDNVRYSVEDGVAVGASKKKPEEEKYQPNASSSIKTEQRFLNVQVKMDESKGLDMIPLQKMQTKKNKTVRLSTSQAAADSIGEDTVPPKYQNILRRLFSDTEKDTTEAGH